jgi:pyruvate/2-oxoglutarate dehydrogenase complex dihydrolipoamide acyltransferase (E2) component
MMGLFSRRRKFSADTGGLGATLIALRLDEGDVAPSHSTVVVFNAGGHARRVAAGKVSCEQGETVFCFHPGPYTVDVTPFASAPEWGLRLRFVVDAANPRVTQQRFDLYLYSETAGRLELADFSAAVEMALQAELAQGALELPPCTTLEEWHAFRAGLNQLMYTRYGVTVDDCVPVDLGDQIDYATILQTRAQQAAEAERVRFIATEAAKAVQSDLAPAAAPAVSTPAAAAAAAAGKAQTNAPGAQSRATSATASPATPGLGRESDVALPSDAAVVRQSAGRTPSGAASVRATATTAEQDARALRRLFLELPALGSGLRLLTLPDGLPIFQQHQAVLLRLGMAALNVNTMPSLAWAAPDQPLSMAGQARRVAQTMIAQSALDEAWSLLARLQLADPQQWPSLLDEADRICTNLETGLSLRRIAQLERMEPSL